MNTAPHFTGDTTMFGEFGQYVLETTAEAFSEQVIEKDIDIWIEELPHDPEDSFLVMGKFKSGEEFPISDLHCQDGADQFIRLLKVYLIMCHISWVLRDSQSYK